MIDRTKFLIKGNGFLGASVTLNQTLNRQNYVIGLHVLDLSPSIDVRNALEYPNLSSDPELGSKAGFRGYPTQKHTLT